VSKRRGLGRGLSSLIPTAPPATSENDIPQTGVHVVALDDIIPNPSQPRQAFAPEALAELAASITLANDMIATRQAIACCLTDLYDAHLIGAWTLGLSTTVGELGGCAGSETQFWIGTQTCPCPG